MSQDDAEDEGDRRFGQEYGNLLIIPFPGLSGRHRCGCVVLVNTTGEVIDRFELPGPFESRRAAYDAAVEHAKARVDEWLSRR